MSFMGVENLMYLSSSFEYKWKRNFSCSLSQYTSMVRSFVCAPKAASSMRSLANTHGMTVEWPGYMCRFTAYGS